MILQVGGGVKTVPPFELESQPEIVIESLELCFRYINVKLFVPPADPRKSQTDCYLQEETKQMLSTIR